MYEAMRAQRRELDRQLDQLENRRENLTERLSTRSPTPDADRTGIEARIVEVDKRIADVEKQIAANDAQVSAAAAVPGAVVEQTEPQFVITSPPEEVVITGVVLTAVVLFPISIALARRIWRRGAMTVTTLPQELWQRLSRLEEAVDAVAMEVERIGEGQRFTNKLFSERALGPGAAQPLDVKAGDPFRVAGGS